jgi:hypothetical protein
MVVSSIVTQDLGILWWALHKYKSYDNTYICNANTDTQEIKFASMRREEIVLMYTCTLICITKYIRVQNYGRVIKVDQVSNRLQQRKLIKKESFQEKRNIQGSSQESTYMYNI